MPLLGYKKRFALMVAELEKRQTIRAKRKRPIKPGDRLYHYVGLRTKYCYKLLESECKQVETIRIDHGGDVHIDGSCLSESAKQILAYRDGFRPMGSAWKQMLEFFTRVHGLPFEGQLIKW